jgi:hypothetical protein
MLQVVTVALGDLSVNCLFDPGNFIHQPITILFHHVQGHSIFGVNDPDEEKAVTLNLIEGDVQNLLVVKSVIGDGHTSSWIS